LLDKKQQVTQIFSNTARHENYCSNVNRPFNVPDRFQLALEGEKLCKAGNCRDGVAFFEAALQVTTRISPIFLSLQVTVGKDPFWP
jgi:hypothetical protein